MTDGATITQNLASANLDSGSIEVGEFRHSWVIQAAFTSLNGTGTFKIQSSNDNTNWVDINNSLSELPVTVSGDDNPHILVAIDGWVLGKYVKFLFTKGTATSGTATITYIKTKQT